MTPETDTTPEADPVTPEIYWNYILMCESKLMEQWTGDIDPLNPKLLELLRTHLTMNPLSVVSIP